MYIDKNGNIDIQTRFSAHIFYLINKKHVANFLETCVTYFITNVQGFGIK